MTSTSSNAGARTPPYPGLLELMERAEVVIAGTIEEVTPGFLFGRLASLLTIGSLEEMVLEAGRGRLELPKNLEVDDEMAGVMTFSELMEKIRSGADRIGARRREPGP